MSVDIGCFNASKEAQILSKEQLLAVACEGFEAKSLEDIQHSIVRLKMNVCKQSVLRSSLVDLN